MPKLTKTYVDAIAPPARGYALHVDTTLKGFGLRVSAGGTKTFYIERRIAGKPHRIKLGRYPDLTVELARRQATKVAGEIASGGDPVADRAQARLEAKTLKEGFADYLERRTLKPQTVFDIQRCMREVYPDWLDKPMTKITADMVSKRHREYGAERSEARANLAMRYLRAIFNFALDIYVGADGTPVLTDNPVARAMRKSWYRVDRRQTVIRPHELGHWVNAVRALPSDDIGDYFLVLLLTGMRRQEALKLRWNDIDLRARTLTVVDPKNHQDHTLPLSDYLAELFTRRKHKTVANAVFADSTGRTIANFRYAQAAITRACGVRFSPHDLRRTFATIAESLDIPAYALKRLLNHSTAGDVTAGYLVVSVERLRDPMQRITDYVLKAAGLRESAPILPFPATSSQP